MPGFEKLHGIKAVAFDVFGTLVEIGEKRRPYRQLMQHIASLGRSPQPGDAATLMSTNVGLAGAAQLFGIDVPPAQIAALELELYAELPTIRLYPEAARCLQTLRDAGYKIGLCSNLSAPYAIPVNGNLKLIQFFRHRQLNIDTPIRSVIDFADCIQSAIPSILVDAFFIITPARRLSRSR